MTFSIGHYKGEPRLCGRPACPLQVAYVCWERRETGNHLTILHRCESHAREFAQKHGLEMPKGPEMPTNA